MPPSRPGSPNPKGWKIYHDVLLYDEGDCPTSNQGFHCGALLVERIAREIARVPALKNGESMKVPQFHRPPGA